MAQDILKADRAFEVIRLDKYARSLFVVLCFCGCVFVVVFLWWCFCVGVVFVWWCFCGCVFVVVFLWWCFCGGVFVLVFLCWCFCVGVVVFLWWCSCVGVVVFLCWCGGVFVVVFLWWCAKYYSSTTKYYSVLQSTTPYYKVLLQYYSNTTLCYKVRLQYYAVLQSTLRPPSETTSERRPSSTTCARASQQGHTQHSRPQAFHTYGFHRRSQHVPLQAHRLLAWNASLFLPAEFRRKCPPPKRLWQPWPICLGFPTHSKSIYLGFPTHFHPKGHSLPSHALAQGIQSWTWPSPSTWGAQLFALKVCSAWCKFLGSPYWVLPCLCLCFHPCFHISPTTGCLWHGKQHQDQWCAKCPSWLPKGWPHWLQKSCGHPMTHTALQVWAACLSKQLCF